MLRGLSVLELRPVVATRNLTRVCGRPFSFEMVLREYGRSAFQSFTRPVVTGPSRACRAWS